MEKDDELKGIGNSYDFGARMLDPRVGRWFTYDQMEGKYPSYSTYNAFKNNPILYIDPDGNDIEPYKFRWNIFGYKTDWNYLRFPNNSEGTRFDKTNNQLIKSSTIYSKAYNRLKNSSRTYRFQAHVIDKGAKKDRRDESLGFFNRGHSGTEDDPFTISLVVNYKINKSYTGNGSTVFEEVFHAAQYDYILDNKQLDFYTSIRMEVEAKLAKNIEGVSGLNDYETITFKGDKKIFEKIRNGKKLSTSEKYLLESAISTLEANIRDQYEPRNEEMKDEFFDHNSDLEYLETLYGQELTNKNAVEVTAPKKNE